MIKISICDDDILELKKATAFINSWSNEKNIKTEILTFDNGDALLENQKKKPADIILLDIMMPLLNGMETAKELRKTDASTMIIFLTSSPEFAVESYEVKASGYVLKPINEEKLDNLLRECVQSISREPENIVVKTSLGYQKIYIDRIECIEAQSRKTVITLDDGSQIEGSETFSSATEYFSNREDFFKCHRSYIVSICNVDRFNSSEIIMKCGKQIPIARGYGKLFKDAYFAYMFKKGKG